MYRAGRASSPLNGYRRHLEWGKWKFLSRGEEDEGRKNGVQPLLQAQISGFSDPGLSASILNLVKAWIRLRSREFKKGDVFFGPDAQTTVAFRRF